MEKKVEGKENPEEAEQEPEPVLAGTKRLRPYAFNAVKREIISNSVDNAFNRRPNSPKSFHIFSDKDVNGPLKCKNYIAPKYEEGPYIAENVGGDPELSEGAETVYCVCRRPYEPKHDNSLKMMMFQCEGSCRKWVHPYCFGMTEKQINELHRNKDTSYFCTFCRPDEADSEQLRHLRERFNGP